MTSSENQANPEPTTASAREERIQSPHDRLINQTLQQAEAARALLAHHLPLEVVQHLKLSTLVPVDTSFIDRNLRRRFADRLFSVEVSDEIARSLAELIPVPAGWKRYVPALELSILDVSRMDDAAMVGEPILQVALTLLKYGRAAELDAVLRSLFQVLSQVISPQQAKNLLETIRVYVMSVNPVVGEEKMNELVSEFWPVQPEPGSVADQLIKKGEARGEARGVALGIAQEKANTIRTLQTILDIPQSPYEQLLGMSPEELIASVESLQQQIAQRLN